MGTVPALHSPSEQVYRLESKTNTMSKDSLTEQKMTGRASCQNTWSCSPPTLTTGNLKFAPIVDFFLGWLESPSSLAGSQFSQLRRSMGGKEKNRLFRKSFLAKKLRDWWKVLRKVMTLNSKEIADNIVRAGQKTTGRKTKS